MGLFSKPAMVLGKLGVPVMRAAIRRRHQMLRPREAWRTGWPAVRLDFDFEILPANLFWSSIKDKQLNEERIP
jgi:hypothetical protein